MSEKDKATGSSSIGAGSRLLLYASSVTSLVLFGVTFSFLIQHQLKLDQLESTLAQHTLDVYTKNPTEDATDLLSRHVRQSDVQNQLKDSTDQHFAKIAELQLQSLRASCLDNEKICIQGPKGNTGERGISGKRGPTGGKGERGDEGRRGVKGEKGDSGARGTSIDPPAITKSPDDVVAREGETAVFECQARGTPKPAIRWHRLDGSQIPHSRTSISNDNKLTIADLQEHDEGSYVCEAENIFGLSHAYATLAVQVAVSFIDVPSGTVSVSLGQTVILDCVASGYPSPTVTWSRVDELPGSSRVEKNGSLVIENVTQSDVGQYVCTAQNDLGKKSHSVTLELQSRNVGGVEGEVVVNGDAVLKCQLCSIRGYSFTWERVGGRLPSRRAKTSGCTLVIRNTTLDDSGKYMCIARSRSGHTLRLEVPLTVTASARITSNFPSIVTVRSGGSVEMQCEGVGPPAPDVYWTKGSQRVRTNKSETLSITNANLQDNGEYRCHAVNYLGRQVKGTRLVITQLAFEDPPPAIVGAALSQTIVINCTASVAPGLPQGYTDWSMPMCQQASSRRNVLPNGTLVITKATVDDSGLYQCKARFGQEKLLANVTVTVPQVDTSWMLTTDSCGGFRQSTYDSSVYYAVSSSNTWDKSKYYYCPSGYRWACTEEGRKILKNNNNWSGTYVYYSQCGWSGYTYRGTYRYIFRFRDSAVTNAYKHAGQYDEHQLNYSTATSSFAGAVCIRD